jgi:hypothetical protein
MSEKPPSPFVGLDKALLRSTQTRSPVPDESPAQSVPSDVTVPQEQSTDTVATDQPAVKKPANNKRTSAVSRQKKAAASVVSDSKQDIELASMLASKANSELSSYPTELVDTIRKIVKLGGKEVSFVRLTPYEKSSLSDIVYTFRKAGNKTTENEISRIAINFIIEDYNQRKTDSLLAKVLASLLA